MKTKTLLATIVSALLVTAASLPASAAAATTYPWIGFYTSGAPSSMDPVRTLEGKIGTHAAVVNFYVADSENFPVNRARAIADHGSIPMITLEFWSAGAAGIVNGSRDAYLASFADAAKAHGGEIWLRPFHEMNSNWYPWAGASGGNNAAQVVAAWRRVRDIFASRGATNVRFVWSPNNESVPNTAANSIESYWPGDAYVDVLAIDGYNFGTSASWSTWRSFDTVMANAYARVTALSTKPLILAETGSVEQGGNKAAWIADMFAKLRTNYPRIVGVCWFNVNDPSANTDWRIDSSPASLEAFRAGVASLPGYPTIPEPTPGKKRVYRFYKKSSGTHFYTASEQERDVVLFTLGATYQLEGVAYEIDTTNAVNGQDLYRFYNPRTGTHLYTASTAERDEVIARLGSSYRYEGVAYTVATSPGPDLTSVFRFYNRLNGTHFYTGSAVERDQVQASLSNMYRYEGPAYFLAP